MEEEERPITMAEMKKLLAAQAEELEKLKASVQANTRVAKGEKRAAYTRKWLNDARLASFTTDTAPKLMFNQHNQSEDMKKWQDKRDALKKKWQQAQLYDPLATWSEAAVYVFFFFFFSIYYA